MKTGAMVARLLLGLVFTVFGLNGFLHFIPNMDVPDAAKGFLGALYATRYMLPLIFATQVVGGILLLTGMFVPLGLAILAPVLVHIFFFHLFLAPGGLGLAIVVCLLEIFLVWANKDAFAPMLRAR